MNVYEHIQNLVDSRGLLGEKIFTEAAAIIYSTYYLRAMIEKGEKLNRARLCKQVNRSLRELDCEELSYSFFRKVV